MVDPGLVQPLSSHLEPGSVRGKMKILDGAKASLHTSDIEEESGTLVERSHYSVQLSGTLVERSHYLVQLSTPLLEPGSARGKSKTNINEAHNSAAASDITSVDKTPQDPG